MFGYVKIYKDELKIKEFNLFRAYYCGLCKALGNRFGQLTRMGLSYDMTFLALMLSSANEEKVCIKREGCIRHIAKRPMVVDNEILNYTAAMSVVLAYFKLVDDIRDDHSIKACLAITAYLLPIRKAKKNYPKQYQEIKGCLQELSTLEQEKCAVIDQPADCFGRILKHLFSPDFLPQSEAMSQLGYLLGRWIYLIDAYADREEDEKKGSYNAVTAAGMDREQIEQGLTYTLSAISHLAEELPLKNKEVIQNIVYLGLRNVQEKVMKNEPVSGFRG